MSRRIFLKQSVMTIAVITRAEEVSSGLLKRTIAGANLPGGCPRNKKEKNGGLISRRPESFFQELISLSMPSVESVGARPNRKVCTRLASQFTSVLSTA